MTGELDKSYLVSGGLRAESPLAISAVFPHSPPLQEEAAVQGRGASESHLGWRNLWTPTPRQARGTSCTHGRVGS